MKCTACSRPVRPIVAVDIDGTLSEYHKALAIFVWNYYDLAGNIHPWDGRGNYEDYLGITQAQYREAKLAYRQSGLKRSAMPYPGAVGFMHWLGSFGVEVWITTTRPWSRLDNVDPDTKFWLERHHIHYDHLLFDDNKYHKLAEIVDHRRVLAVIDDLPEMLDAAAESLPWAVRIMVARDHNQWETDRYRTDDWEKIAIEIGRAYNQWELE